MSAPVDDRWNTAHEVDSKSDFAQRRRVVRRETMNTTSSGVRLASKKPSRTSRTDLGHPRLDRDRCHSSGSASGVREHRVDRTSRQ
jgi:hypothetical protein